MERFPWSVVPVLCLVVAGCVSEPVLCTPQDVDTLSWVQEGYVESIWHLVQVPMPGETDLPHDPGLGPDAYILKWGDRGGPWDVPLDAYPVSKWSHIPNATYRVMDGAWALAFSQNETVVTFDTRRDFATDGSLVADMRTVIRNVSSANETQAARAIDDAVRNATGGKYTLTIPGTPRIAHIWNENGPTWSLAGQDLYYAHTGPWTFAVDVNGITVDRSKGPDHHVDLRDRVWADPSALDPDHFPRLDEEPRTMEEAIEWFQVLAAMNDAEATDIRVAGAGEDCALPPGVGVLPERA